MFRLRTALALAATLVIGIGLAACEAEEPGSGAEAAAGAPLPAAVPEGFFLDAAPDGAKLIHELKPSAKEGDEVVLRARVGGAVEPFVESRAAMVVADGTGITACSDRPGDGCATPWDYCCDTPDAIVAHTATVQVVGADGRPLPGSLEGLGGIDKLRHVVVQGVVGPRPDAKVLVINATHIFVEPRN